MGRGEGEEGLCDENVNIGERGCVCEGYEEGGHKRSAGRVRAGDDEDAAHFCHLYEGIFALVRVGVLVLVSWVPRCQSSSSK